MNKQGIDYFPLEYNFWSDDKILDISTNFPEYGEIITIKLLSKIYNNEGYYCKWDDNAIKLFNNQFFHEKIKHEYIKNVVNRLIEINFFNKYIYNKYKILTSYSIQKRFLFAVKRRKNTNEHQIHKDYEISYTMYTRCKHDVYTMCESSTHDVNMMYTRCAEKDSIVQDSIEKNSIEHDSIVHDSINKDIVESKKQIPPSATVENEKILYDDEELEPLPDLNAVDEKCTNKQLEVNKDSKTKDQKKVSKKFVPPTIEEIRLFRDKNNLDDNVDAFYSYYESNGWMVGKNKMVKWEYAYRNWIARNNNKTSNSHKGDGRYKPFTHVNDDCKYVKITEVNNI